MALDRIVQAYQRATNIFLAAAAEVPVDGLDQRPGPGEWTPRQIIHHLADSETTSYIRLRRLLAEPTGALIQGYDERAWSECSAMGYTELPIEHSLAVFTAVRAASADVLARIEATDLERYGEHTEIGHYTLAHWVEIYSRHPREHAEQMRGALGA